MHSDGYYFGSTLARRLDYFAFPRTGSHYLWACLTGLLDLVFFPNEFVHNPEARQRAEEIDPLATYALRLREDGIPVQPVHIEAAANGLHGLPAWRGNPVVILIRDPFPTIFSWFHTATQRWGADIPDPDAWTRDAFDRFATFYDAAFEVARAHPDAVHLVRFEHLRASPDALAALVAFIGVRPKLSPAFVHACTAFDRFTRPGNRTFYRRGDDNAWRGDATWSRRLLASAPPNLARFGYPPPTEETT